MELDRLSDHFGKKFSVTPTMNRKQIAKAVGMSGSEVDVRGTAAHMSHSLEVHRSAYQGKQNSGETIERYVTSYAHVVTMEAPCFLDARLF